MAYSMTGQIGSAASVCEVVSRFSSAVKTVRVPRLASRGQFPIENFRALFGRSSRCWMYGRWAGLLAE